MLQVLWKSGAVFYAKATQPQSMTHLETDSNLYDDLSIHMTEIPLPAEVVFLALSSKNLILPHTISFHEHFSPIFQTLP